MTAPVLEIRDLTKRYRGKRGVLANDGIDLDVAPGEVVGLLGHNGAGKTTLVNQLTGIVSPSRGTIHLAGNDAIAHPELARKAASVQAQANVPITGLTPRTAITLVGKLRGADPTRAEQRASYLIDALELGPWASTPAEKISGGVARLTAFSMACIAPGELLVLDEPTNDVDPVRRRALWDVIGQVAAEGTGVLLVTHNVAEAERAVDRLTILDEGRVIAAGTPAGLTAPLRDHLTLAIDLVPGLTPPWPSLIGHVELGPLRASATISADAAPAAVTWAQFAAASGLIERYALIAPSLEDVYIRLTGKPAQKEACADDAPDQPRPTAQPQPTAR